MSRIAPVPYRTLVRVLEHEGFTLTRQRGDHMIFSRAGILRPVVVTRYDPLPVFIIRVRLPSNGTQIQSKSLLRLHLRVLGHP
jgi:predicted RNA binding protein YcfA (HicA-like mRNA interferase family)